MKGKPEERVSVRYLSKILGYEVSKYKLCFLQKLSSNKSVLDDLKIPVFVHFPKTITIYKHILNRNQHKAKL